MTDNSGINQMNEPQSGGNGGRVFIGLLGTIVVLALLIGTWGSDTNVDIFGLDLRLSWVILIAYIAGVLTGRFPIRRR